MQIFNGLTEWAALAGYGFTPVGSPDSAISWTDPGGEIRFYIRGDGAESFTLSVAERLLPKQFELCGMSLRTIERYLFGVFGTSLRAKRGRLRLKVRFTRGSASARVFNRRNGHRRLSVPSEPERFGGQSEGTGRPRGAGEAFASVVGIGRGFGGDFQSSCGASTF
ncbi:hypothetical protein H7J06_09005 [Mycobacterium hodleri]|nr:hypothetical protein [Mycolicibacterium hodleri]